MGNELLTQVGNVGSSTTTTPNTPNYNTFGFNNSIAGSLFNIGMNGKNYQNDMMMPDFLKTGNMTDEQRASIFGGFNIPQPQQTPYNIPPQSSQYPQISVQQNPQNSASVEQLDQYYNELLAKNPNIRMTEKGNLYELSNAGKKTGAITGVIAGLSSGIFKLCKGKSLAKAFNLKELAVKLPVLAIAGWALGSVIDAFANSSSAKQADNLA